ncbi:hypothetical protein RhiLY_06391 [Ceratobasidium sp. AG-Ba]|nr:hypothetical protein RhiLY_06391 [Ceratobasidium sp. AG-Ba]
MSLRILKLKGIRLDFHIDVGELALTIPIVEVLVFPSQELNYEQLYRLAANLPGLRELAFSLQTGYLSHFARNVPVISHLPITLDLCNYRSIHKEHSSLFKHDVA